jgi:DNA polymerase-1
VAEELLIVDGHSLMFRAFHAIPLLDYDGVYTNAVQGFFLMLFKAFQNRKPAYCVVCFDEHAPTFRHTVYEAYKAGRKPMPEELKPQFKVIKELLQAMGLGVVSLEGYEADDLLGTLSMDANKKGIDALLLTGDRDALQLVDDHTRVLMTKKGISETKLFTPEKVWSDYGIMPSQVPDWKGLAGDASDNIPGVPGVGDKTAVKLLNEYATLERVLECADGIPGKLGEKLRQNRAQALLSKELATIRRDAPAEYDMRACDLSRLKDAAPVFNKYGLSILTGRLNALFAEEQTDATLANTQMPALISTEETLNSLPDIAGLASRMAAHNHPVAVHLGETLSLACDGKKWRVRTEYDLLTPGITQDEALRALGPLLLSNKLIIHDGKAFMHRLSCMGIAPAAPFFDTMIAQYLINPQEKSYALGGFTEENAAGVYALYLKQRERLKAEGMEPLYETVEGPLVGVLFHMEREGFRADTDVLTELGGEYAYQIERLKAEVYRLTGVDGFNLNSPQQLGKVLFEVLALKHGKKSKSGAYSTGADILENLIGEHPSIPSILDYRRLSKLNSTYIEGLLRLTDADGRIHTTFDQTATATGRISSNEPNLQNIPVRTDIGREIRRAFIPRDGWLLLDADYSQIELRILAHFSGDPAMLEAFRLGQDIHTRTAAEVFGVKMADVTPAMRSSAKAVNFGLVYGISEFGLSRNIGMSRYDAAQFIETYFERYPGVKRYMNEAVAKGKSEGYAVTLMGRRRYLPELDSDKANVRDFGRRVAMNMPIQGTAADIIKLAMVQTARSLAGAGLQARLILQVHDELLLECPPEECDEASMLLQNAMEGVVSLDVPLTAKVSRGASWFETK